MPAPLNPIGILSGTPATIFNISHIFSNINHKTNKLKLETELIRLESDLNDWDKIPFYKAYKLEIPEVASKTPEEIKAMRTRMEEIKKELSP